MGASECTPQMAVPKHTECTPHMAPECCQPHMCVRGVDALDDRECADILLVNGAVRGEVVDVRRALEMGASPNTLAGLTLKMGEPTKGRRRGTAVHTTPIMRCCENGHEDVMLCLIEAKASPVQCDSHGWSALCYALGAGEMKLAQLLWSRIDKKKHRSQRELVQKLSKELIAKCEREVGKEAANKVQQELDHPT